MFHKKKINFWRLAVFYIGVTAVILLLLWGSPFKSPPAMMDGSMGNMMKSMHMTNPTIYGLLGNPEAQQQQQTNENANHHNNSPAYNMGILTTGIVFLLLPLIVGGSIILAIIWIK
ncbi:MAG: hypothetical protein AB2421_06515 [Thermotaleaceae bacterium]